MVHNIGCLGGESQWMPEDKDFVIPDRAVACIGVFLIRLSFGSFRIENTRTKRYQSL